MGVAVLPGNDTVESSATEVREPANDTWLLLLKFQSLYQVETIILLAYSPPGQVSLTYRCLPDGILRIKRFLHLRRVIQTRPFILDINLVEICTSRLESHIIFKQLSTNIFNKYHIDHSNRSRWDRDVLFLLTSIMIEFRASHVTKQLHN